MGTNIIRSRWAAVGAAVAITLGAGGIGLVSATSPSDAVAYVPIDPCRLADTRAGGENVGPRSTPIGAGETLGILAVGNNGNCTGIPASATSLQLNVTAVGATVETFLTIWGSGTQPVVSSLNPALGQPPTPNAVTTGLTAGGAINIYNNLGTVNVIVDVAGYYTDHNHDDRYYTETEADAALSDKVTSDDGKSAYAFVCTAASTQGIGVEYDVTVNCGWAYNPSGDAVTVERTAVGLYTVRFPGLNMTSGHVQVTAYGSTNTQCKIGGWSGSSMSVRCFDPAGGLANGPFTILALD